MGSLDGGEGPPRVGRGEGTQADVGGLRRATWVDSAGRRGWAPQGAVSASGSAWSRAAPARRFWNLTGLWPSAPSGIPAAAFWSWGPTPELRKPQHPFVVWWRCRGSAPLPELRRRPARTCGSSAEGVELAVASEAAARAPTQKRGTGLHRPLDHPPRRLPVSSWGHRVNHPSWSTFCRVTSPPAFLAARRGAQLLSSRGAPGARCSPGPLRPLPSGPCCTHSQPPAPLSALRTRPSGAGPEWSYVSHSAGCIIPRPLAFPLYGSHSLALASSPFQLCATVALSSPPAPARLSPAPPRPACWTSVATEQQSPALLIPQGGASKPSPRPGPAAPWHPLSAHSLLQKRRQRGGAHFPRTPLCSPSLGPASPQHFCWAVQDLLGAHEALSGRSAAVPFLLASRSRFIFLTFKKLFGKHWVCPS